MPRWSVPVLTTCALLLASPGGGAPVPAAKGPVVEVVLCVDATHDMAAALAALRRDFPAICERLAQGRPRPALRVGLVAYRDRGDAFLTRITDLTSDLSVIHLALAELAAEGGGDAPEAVNQALHEAVQLISWSPDRAAARHVVLLGNAPPHLDYDDDIPYRETCRAAAARGVVIHAVQVGDDAECAACWQDIARRTGGRYLPLAAGEGLRAAVGWLLGPP